MKSQKKNPFKPSILIHYLSSLNEHYTNVDGILAYGTTNSNWATT